MLVWIAATLALATGWGASTRTRDWLVPRLVEVGLSPANADGVHRGLRKAGHVAAYAAFALLARWALRGRRRRAPTALLSATALALLDETIQSQSPGRGGSPLDVLLDVGAAALALAWAERLRPVPAPPAPPAPRSG